MTDTAKIFMNGRSQAVRLPAAYRFDAKEVSIRRDPKTGDVILSKRKQTTREEWDRLFTHIAQSVKEAPEEFEGFMEYRPHNRPFKPRDIF